MQSDFAPSLLQASAVPFRRAGERASEFCLITSISSGRWGFPKGLIDPGETPIEAGLKEAHEEAGLHGQILGEPLGEYQYAKWGSMLSVTAYLMEVSRADAQWLEADRRQRQWVSAESAAACSTDVPGEAASLGSPPAGRNRSTENRRRVNGQERQRALLARTDYLAPACASAMTLAIFTGLRLRYVCFHRRPP